MEALIASALAVISKTMDMFPDYEQSKREKFHKLRTEYENEQKKPYGIRNDRLVLDLSDELRLFIESFHKIISASSVEGLRTH